MQACANCGERNPDRARFCMGCGVALGRVLRGVEERKVVSMVFADLEGSTAMGAMLDQEAIRSLMTWFYSTAREILERHGGTVEKFIGDAVMGVFGVPRVHRDDALRAVLAAHELQDAIERANPELTERWGTGLHVRIGVNTGEVVVGDPRTGSSFVSGDAVNVTARLEQAAAADEILLGEETYRVIGDSAEADPLAPMSLRGEPEPIRAYRLVRVARISERRVGSTLVGREGELSTLREHLAVVEETGRPLMTLLLGPPGIGKTRLLDEVAKSVSDRVVLTTIGCSPDRELDGRSLAASLVRRVASLDEASPSDARAAIVSLLDEPERSGLVADELLGVLGLGPAGTAEGAAWAVRAFIRAVTARRPLLIEIDDLQLAATEAFTLLSGLLETSTALWVLASAHPELLADHATELRTVERLIRTVRVGPLSTHEASRVARYLVDGPLEPAAERSIVEAAEGNPLFLGEIVRMLRDRGAIREGPHGWSLIGDASAIPPSIRSVTSARLDALSDADRAVLCVASVIGTEAALDDVRALSAKVGIGAADASVTRLVERQLLRRTDAEHLRFGHGVIREVAYATLTKARRAELHEACADLIEQRGDDAETGEHLERAFELRRSLGPLDGHRRQLAVRAAELLARAGRAALDGHSRSAAGAFERRAAELAAAIAEHVSSDVADLAFRLGAWDDVVAMLDRVDPLETEEAHHLGVALLKRADARRTGDDVERGRRLLRLAGDDGDTDALAALAGSWKGLDDDHALTLYRSVLTLDPSDPYALGNHLEYVVERTRSLAPVDECRDGIEEAIRRRRRQALRGEDLPWSWYDLAKFQLILGRTAPANRAAAAGVLTSTASFMPSSVCGSIERLWRAVRLPGAVELITLLRLARVAVFDDPITAIADLCTPDAPRLRPPVVILAGASAEASAPTVSVLRRPLIDAMGGRVLTVISGGTATGVSALAGDLACALPDLAAIGYLPSSAAPSPTAVDRYAELRRTAGETFGLLEPLRYWADILASGVAPADVRLLGVGGGELSAIEYRAALAFGAHVAVIRGTGGEAAALLQDPTWAASDRLHDIVADETDLRAFLEVSRGT